MAKQPKLNDVVCFRGDRLFNGAVNINWFGTDPQKSEVAANAFVFHGPKYHGVDQNDVGVTHEHRLIDTASFSRSIINRCYGVEDQPFTLAIAGYGTGKSHLGLTLANLLSSPQSQTAQNILQAIANADQVIGREIRLNLGDTVQPCLVVVLNGMQSFDFTAEFTKQIVSRLKQDGHDAQPFDELRPRFGQAVSLIRMSNESVVRQLVAALDVGPLDQIIAELEQQDERIYAKVHDFFASQGMTIRALAGESVKDVIDIAAREYCGNGKPYRSLLVLFDEFGKYTEFATMRSQIAGSGVLQDLFEGIQANAGTACFVGFIQFDLNTYVDRVAPEYKNEIIRYVTRYQLADKLFLSSNLETLIASLLEKRKPELLDEKFNSSKALQQTSRAMANILRWFPSAQKYRLWVNSEQFHNVVGKGCWPLSPYTTWLLFYLTSAGKYLQERSALALLGEVFQRFGSEKFVDKKDWTISPAEIWSEMLLQDLISAEEMGLQGSIAHAYATVIAKHGSRFTHELILLLRAVVLASKLGLQADDKEEAIQALACFAGVSGELAIQGIRILQEEYNVLEWDDTFKSFDILGDAVPRTQFLAFIRQKSRSYSEADRAQLFASKALEWCDLLENIECDFAEANKITTREWRYGAVAINMNYLASQIKIASEQWAAAVEVEVPRGTVIYLFVEPNRDLAAVELESRQLLRAVAQEQNQVALPILLVLLHDEAGILGQALAEYAVLLDMGEADKAKFGNLIGAHKEKLAKAIRGHIEKMIKDRHYVSGLQKAITSKRLRQVGGELFARIYTDPIPFPFDGFNTARGNAAETCHELTRELLNSKLDFEGVLAKPVKSKNRAIRVLKDTWGVFNPSQGTISRRPSLPTIRSVTEKWDDILISEQRLPVGEIIKQLCLPPYGANIASAGLLLGVFVAPRANDLVVEKDGQQIAISQWLQEGVFKGKFINLLTASGVKLLKLGEASSEWETLLDEWEQCQDHLSKFSMLKRSAELQSRIPVPPMLVYRHQAFMEQSRFSSEAIDKMEKKQDEAISKLRNGMEREDVALLVWGASDLKKIYDQMVEEYPAWTQSQKAEIATGLEKSKLAIQNYFSRWITQQVPKADTPVAVGDFKHKMLRIVGPNLKKLGLEAEADILEEHTLKVIRNAEAIAESKQITRDIRTWLTSHSDAARIGRVAELRAIRQVGQEHIKKLQEIAKNVQLEEIGNIFDELVYFIEKLKQSEDKIVERAEKIWESNIEGIVDIEKILDEVDSLVTAFENLPTDQEDFHLMRRALRHYRDCYFRLSDKNISWDVFERSFADIKNQTSQIFGEDDELPWEPIETIQIFYDDISETRESESAAWVDQIIAEAQNVDTMSAPEANQLLSRINSPPPMITPTHEKKIDVISTNVVARLEALKLEWLIEKFKELQAESKKEFLHKAQQLLG